ncbi:MAG: DUF4115 domain-containing protein [Proteobacteria bacterium]|nr:DUF4115 domain-containing protein [Pseudomonadota bacterium]
MSSQSPPPPINPDEKSQENLAGAASARALEEVSEALNGLKELAARVHPPMARPRTETREDLSQEQLSLELPQASVPPPVKISRRPRVGDTLREVRESAGFTLEDVAEEVKIKLIYLQAIEEGRYGDLPSRTYAVGFVRAYAQALGLQSEELVARCRAEVGTMTQISAPLVMPEPAADKRLPGGTLMAACAVLAVVVYAASYGFLRPQPAVMPAAVLPPAPVLEAKAPEKIEPEKKVETEKKAEAETPPAKPETVKASLPAEDSAKTEMPEESPAPEAAESENEKPDADSLAHGLAQTGPVAHEVQIDPAAAAIEEPPAVVPVPKPVKGAAKVKPPSRIKIRASDDTEVSILDSQGRVLTERIIHKGEAYFVPDHRHYTLSTTNAGAIRLQVDGHDMAPLGGAGEAMHNIPLDPDDLLQALE